MTTLFQKGVCTPVAVHSAISTDECTHKQKDISDDCNKFYFSNISSMQSFVTQYFKQHKIQVIFFNKSNPTPIDMNLRLFNYEFTNEPDVRIQTVAS